MKPRSRFELQAEVERIEGSLLDRAEKDARQRVLLETIQIMRDIERIRWGQGGMR